jgi:hypothetical protein
MARATPILPSLNAGELSPYLEGRVDFDQYPKGFRKLENWVPLVQGPVTKRPGTRYVATSKHNDRQHIVKDFIFSDDDAYVLEIGHEYIRFYTDRGQVLSGGSVYEISTPYDEQDLTLLRFTQSADVIYITHPLYVSRKLSRYAATNWVLEEIPFENGPFDVENTTTTTIQASAVTGSVTLTASASIFTSGQVGAFLKLTQENNGSVNPWEAGKAITAGNIRSYDGNFYEAQNSATTGGDPPIHTDGDVIDGTGTVTWRYLHSGFGVLQITSVVSGTQAVANVTSRLPDAVSTSATKYWAEGAWSSEKGYPGAVAFSGDRLFFGGSIAAPQTIWGSVVGSYVDFKPGTEDDSSLTLTISSSDVNQIRWIDDDEKGLLVGTARGEWVLRPSANNEALTPFNAKATRVTNFGSNFVEPARVHKAVMFIQSAAKKLREMAYTLDVDGFSAPDMTVRAEHITGGGVVSMCYQAQPNPVIWAARAGGELIGLSYERDQDVLAWHQHPLGGTDTIVESVTAIPTPDGFADELWLSVKRTINGSTVRTVEYMTEFFGHDTAQDDAFFVDCGATYDGAAATTISGLDWLEGETVKVLKDGATHPDVTVSSGEITLNSAGEKVHIGLGYSAVAVTENLEAGQSEGTAQGKKGRVSKALFRLYRTGVFAAGKSAEQTEEIALRNSTDQMGSAPSLMSEDKEVPWNSGWDEECLIAFVSAQPTPATVLAIMPTIERTN